MPILFSYLFALSFFFLIALYLVQLSIQKDSHSHYFYCVVQEVLHSGEPYSHFFHYINRFWPS